MNNELYLSPGVFFCVIAQSGVFLDLNQDNYGLVSLGDLRGADSGSAARRDHAIAEALSEHRAALLEAGLLTMDKALGAPLDAFSSIEHARVEIFEERDGRPFGLTGEAAKGLRLSARDLLHVFLAWRSASRALRQRHISEIVGGIRQAKSGLQKRSYDPARLRRDVAVFMRLRPWCFEPYLCLRDSLALMNFLIRRHHAATWIFGVRAQPFSAHCWIQANGLLLNDGAEYSAGFTPIMAI